MALGSAIDTFGKPFEGVYLAQAGNRILTRISGEASAEIPYGRVVQDGPAGATAKLITGPANKFVGVVGHQYADIPDVEVGSIGVLPGKMLNIIETGEVYVHVEEAVNPTSPVRFRVTAAGAGLGRFRTSSAGAGLSVLAPSFRYRHAATAGSRVLCYVDFRSTLTAD